ncbi:MAG: 23S rRNA (uracil(1939)-C(5))-methyltransferase RlmD [Ruminococcus sp.]|jgi:23S rRNA (uracil1939-C5)-methyltransferase|nr:23S rRNA (uracil(1939)-C(5))-methyltransferase RlmD [Ruminococcus sp.]
MLAKNDIISLNIARITSEGFGIGKHEGMAVFVPFSAVGDSLRVKIVKVNKNFAYGIIESTLQSSPTRIKPDCKVFGKCGGCDFRHISYTAELSAKQRITSDAFTRIGGFEITDIPIYGARQLDHYRNKAQIPVTEGVLGEYICGFYAPRSHRIVPHESCLLQPKVFDNIEKRAMELINGAGASASVSKIKHIYIRQGSHSGQIMLVFVTSANIKQEIMPIAEKCYTEFPMIRSVMMNIQPEDNNVILGNENILLFGSETITDEICGNKAVLSPNSFYQVNTPQAENLYKLAVNAAELTGEETVLDLYCGAGTIGMAFARYARRVVGIEIVPEAVANAVNNIVANRIENMEVFEGDAADMLGFVKKKELTPDIIVTDPPRKGCSTETLSAIMETSPEKVIMISCDPATAARDCKILRDEGGYTLKSLCTVDMFPRTANVECLAVMVKNNE